MIRALLVALLLATGGASAAVAAPETTTFTIGYVELTGDARYAPRRSYAGIEARPRFRPVLGAELAIRGSRIMGRALGMRFTLARLAGTTAAQVADEMARLGRETGVRFFLVDLPADVLIAVADATAGKGFRLLNVSAPDDALRGTQCRAHVLHTLPSRAMLADALAQYLAAKRWRRVLMLRGPLPADRLLSTAFEGAARRFGLEIIGRKDFIPGNDPRQREKNNVALMTAGGAYDVVFVADTDGEFGRTVPYQTNKPRPVVGTEGLIAGAWHWSWERHGAPQLSQRFEKRATRRMQGADWAAWAAVKAIVEAAVRVKSADFEAVSAFMGGEKLTLDVYKGTPSSFRPWDNQLRQPILLHTANAVAARAPLKGFLHPTEYMDTLGYDRDDNKCKF